MSRTKMKKLPLNSFFLDMALKARSLSINKITDDTNENYIECDRRTITRARSEGHINPKILDKIGQKLNVDPRWLTGADLQLNPRLINNYEYCKVENHPYPWISIQRKGINFSQYFENLLLLHGVLLKQFESLTENKQHGLEMELDLVVQMVIFKYFGENLEFDGGFLSNQHLRELSCAVLSGEKYDELFELIEK